jgi:Putative beta-barrel porin 2
MELRLSVAAKLGSRAVNAKSPWPIGLALACAISTPCMAQMAAVPSYGISAPQITPGVDQTLVGLDLTGGYDSNVARSSAAVAAERGITPEDFFIDPAGDLTVSRVFGRETIFLEASAGYRAYVRNSILDRSNIQVQGGGVGQLSVCETSLTGAYSRAQADLEDLVITTGGKPVTSIADARQNAIVDFTATCGRAIGFAPTFNVSESWQTNSNPEFQLIDSHIFSGSGGVTYRNPVLGQVSLTGQYSDIVYPNRVFDILVPAGLETVTFGFKTIGGGITYVRTLGSRLTGTVALSYEKLEPTVAVTQGFSGLTYNLDVTYQLTPRLSLTAQVAKATTPSNELDAAFSISQLYSAQANYAFGPQMSVGLGAYHNNQQYGGFLVPVVDILTEQTTTSVFGTVSRKLNRRLSVATSLTYSQRAANFPGLNYTDVLLSITASSTF